MGGKNKDREKKQREARKQNKLKKTVTPEKRRRGKIQIAFLIGMVILAAVLVIYLQS